MTALDFNRDEQKQSTAMTKAREHIETLERIQQAEKEEHDEMQFTIEQWRVALRAEPNEEQQVQLNRQEELLNSSLKEWDDREQELRQLRKRLERDIWRAFHTTATS